MIDPTLIQAFGEGMSEELAPQLQQTAQAANPTGLRRFTQRTPQQMMQSFFSSRAGSPYAQFQRMGAAPVENFLFQNRPQAVFDAFAQQGQAQSQMQPGMEMAQRAAEQLNMAPRMPMPQQQSQPMQSQVQPTVQPQRVMNQDQRRRYNEIRRTQGQDAAAQFRGKIKTRKGM